MMMPGSPHRKMVERHGARLPGSVEANAKPAFSRHAGGVAAAVTFARCRAKVGIRRAPRPSEAELVHGVPIFLEQLIETLQPRLQSGPAPMMLGAARHGDELLRRGKTVAQAIHDYGDLCQSITTSAIASPSEQPANCLFVMTTPYWTT